MRTLVLRENDSFFTLTEDMVFLPTKVLTDTKLRAQHRLMNFGIVDSTGVPLSFPQSSPLQNTYLAQIGDKVQIVEIRNGNFFLGDNVPNELSLFVQTSSNMQLTENDTTLTYFIVKNLDLQVDQPEPNSVAGELVIQEFKEGDAPPVPIDGIFRSNQSVFFAPYVDNIIDLASFDVLVTNGEPTSSQETSETQETQSSQESTSSLSSSSSSSSTLGYYIAAIILTVILILIITLNGNF